MCARMLGVPLMRGGDPIGAFALARAGPFPSRSVRLISSRPSPTKPSLRSRTCGCSLKCRRARATSTEALQQQTATADVLKVISQSVFDLDTVLQTLIDTAVRLTHGSRGTIFIRHDDVLIARAFHSNVPGQLRAYLAATTWRLDGDSHMAKAAREGVIVHVPDLSKSETESDREVKKRASFGAGLLDAADARRRGDRRFRGAAEQPIAFTDREIELVQTFADQAVIAIENARLFGEVQAKTRDLEGALAQQTATADVLKVIGRSAFDLETVLNTLISSAQTLCGADFGAICLREGEYFHAYATSGVDPAFLAALRSKPQHIDDKSLTPRVGRTARIEHVPDRLLDPDYAAPEGTEAVVRPRTLLGVPLLRDGRVEGTFVLMRVDCRPFEPRNIDLAQTFADQAMIAIGNVRLFDEVKSRTRDLEESLAQQTATADVLKVISRSVFDLQTVFDTLVESAYRLSGAVMGLLYLRGETAFECKAIAGLGVEDASVLFKGRPILGGRGTAAERVIQTGDVQIISDLLTDSDFDPRVKFAILSAGDTGLAGFVRCWRFR